ncbi:MULTISPECIES: ROK family protein [unclassified Ruegeria]|uniref:glucokinase n=1 Tax=unclassified Ruegeria TaxID=2625375 RepID=UPI0020C54591|nr:MULTISPECIES: ROK family protein [unclassified Ruegeria]
MSTARFPTPTLAKPSWTLVADIGGTNMRLGVVIDGELTELHKFPTGTNSDLLDAFHATRDVVGSNPLAVVAAGAGPVRDGTIHLTNAQVTLSETDIAKATGAEKTFVINDFTAAAWSVAEIGKDDVQVLQGDPTPPTGTRLVVGPGTGLGVGALLWSQGRYHTASGEGGHVGLAPRYREEVAVFEAARTLVPECFFGDSLAVEAEMFLSGTGLPVLYQAIGLAEGLTDVAARPAKDILQDAQTATDPVAVRCAEMFTTHLAAVIGDISVTLMPFGGIFLLGGVADKNRWLFGEAFRSAFNAGGRFDSVRQGLNLYISNHAEFGVIGANNFCKSALSD